MLYSEKMKEILTKFGVDVATLPDSLYSTMLDAISKCEPTIISDSSLTGIIECTARTLESSEITKVRSYGVCENGFLETVNLPNCKTIGSHAFDRCSSLENVNIPKCEEIGSYGFYFCTRIKSIALPSCKSIGINAFDDCSNLKEVNFLGATEIPEVSSDSFTDTSPELVIIVPNTLLDDWKTTGSWIKYADKIKGGD